MFREMRRKKQQLSEENCRRLLLNGTSGVLALSGDDGYPYAVPISYVYDGEKIYFHCARSGHKLDAVKREPKASFCVIGQDQVVPDEYTTYFRSVIVFGRIRILEDGQEKLSAARKLGVRYLPDGTPEALQNEIDKYWNAFCMLEMTIDHMTGKEAKELVGQK